MPPGLTGWLAVGLGMLLIGCQGRDLSPSAALADPMAHALEAMDHADYETAATLLRQVLAADRSNLEAHYGLAVSASHLNLRDEAIREFRWVVGHGPADSSEVKTARDWLILAGVFVEEGPGRPEATTSEEGAGPGQSNLATVSGRVTGDENGAVKPLARLQLFLKGVPGSPAAAEYHVIRTDQDGNYRFTNVVPGEYILTDRVASPRTWRLRVQARPGQDLNLDLTPQNSVRTRDDFPEAG